MKFLADENIEKTIVQALKDLSYDVIWIGDDYRSISDSNVLNICVAQKRILITNDKDFGELVFLEKRVSEGVLLLRYEKEDSNEKVKKVIFFIKKYKNRIKNNFIVLSEKGIRIRKIK